MPAHSWQPHYFEPNQVLNGIIGQVHVCRCRKCHTEDVCFDHELPSPGDDCTEKKPAWVCPMPQKAQVTKEDIIKTDYPAKRTGFEAKRRRK